MHDVFVSYSQIDKAVADAVVAGLEADGIRCWVAPRDITPGTSWGEAIVDAISDSKAMALVLSSNSNASRQVIREVERAVSSGVVIVPLRIEDIDPTGAMAYFLATEHWLDALAPPLEDHIDRLSGAISSLLSGEAPARAAARPAPPPPPSRRVPPWGWGAAAIAVGAVVVAILLPGGSDPGQETASTQGTTTTAATTTSTTTTTLPSPVVSLVEVASYRTSRAANELAVDGTFLALANGTDGLIYMSVADPSQPRPIAEYSAPDAEEVLLDGSIAYALVGEFARSLLIVDLDGSGGYGLSGEQGQRPASDSLYRLDLEGDFLYIGGHDYVGIVYVADPFSPVLVAEWEPRGSTGNPANPHVTGDLGLFGAGWDGLYVMDLSDPSRPVEVGGMDTPNWVIDVESTGDVAFLTLGETGLAAVDISDPTTPILISRIDLPGFASPLALSDGLAFVGLEPDPSSDDGRTTAALAIVDVADPESMELVDVVGEYELVGGLAVSAGHVFLTDTARGLFVYEIVGS